MGFTVTGLAAKSDGTDEAMQWKCRPGGGMRIGRLDAVADADLSHDDISEARTQLFSTQDRPRTPVGTLRRQKSGENYFVYRWGRGAMGRYDWI
ncbi:hypothetical protein [Streptomyces sp. TLI_146]|uniref:hypothetical protein n=1 Tax=Streptomyces sp. TLI_146 TaxID=1938858 RepID=UPI000C70D172|nr:hypothetical protein [Streptomyces sp. TLI_146]PKV82817.1 hypothetical protein BX283_0278 [Streptomyces sp. TLI_146]